MPTSIVEHTKLKTYSVITLVFGATMQFHNISSANLLLVHGKLCLELPDEVITKMQLSESDSVDFSLKETTLKVWKSPRQAVPQDILDELDTLFKSNEQIISQWLCTPRANFEGKAAIELVNTPEGIKLIQDFIWQLKIGDFS